MRIRILGHIRQIPTAFSTNELAFYCLTNSFELPLRDRLAYRLQQHYPKYQIKREWKKVDISIHGKDKVPKSLIEIKYSVASSIVKKRDKEKIRILKSLKNQYIKDKKFCKDWHGLVFLSCALSEVPKSYDFQVTRIKAINKYVGQYSPKGWRLEIDRAITLHFPKNEFEVKSGFVHAGFCFETNVILLWFLISRKH